ncbi:MAG: hypothetical protein OQL19_10535 [Gammaproteobacteria bacterium]|nr:hypothetical protein [Gammaproteobacteria bacterium]
MLLLAPVFSYASDDFLTPVTSSHKKIEQLLEFSSPTKHSISICYNYGCKTRQIITIRQDDILAIKKIFNQFKNTQYGERHAIAQAVALLENIAGKQAPVNTDRAKNYNDLALPGRMDCIDSTVNTTHYLEFINSLGLIDQHILQQPVYRSPFLMGQHWAAQIKDKNDGQRYAVDSWQTNNGQPPIIQAVEKWTTREEIKNL